MFPRSWRAPFRSFACIETMNRAAGTERGSVSRSTSPCKPSCCGSQTRAPRSGSWKGSRPVGPTCRAVASLRRRELLPARRSFRATAGAKADEVSLPWMLEGVGCSPLDHPKSQRRSTCSLGHLPSAIFHLLWLRLCRRMSLTCGALNHKVFPHCDA